MPNCPQITQIRHNKGYVAGHMHTIDFEIDLTNGNPPPDRYEWDWGDEARNTTTTEARASHTYIRPVTDDTPVTVTVKAIGPGACETVATVSPMLFGPHNPPPPIPHMAILDEYLISETETTVTYEFDVRTFSSPKFTYFEWDWGDGSPKSSSDAPTSSHTFAKPLGQDLNLTITVSGWFVHFGSPDSYSRFPFALRSIPCPTIDKINESETGRTLRTQEKQFSLELTTYGITPQQFEWSWGDGTPHTISTTPQATHVYQRPLGSGASAPLTVSIQGLPHCAPVLSHQVALDGTCPRIIRIETSALAQDATDTSYKVSAVAVLEEDFLHESYEWDWGDGSPNTTTAVPTATHTYTRPAGDAETKILTLTGTGPGGCSSGQSTTVSVPGLCPAIAQIMVSYGDLSAGTQTVHFEAILVPDIAADSFSWDWGDGTPVQESPGPKISHAYKRPPGSEQNRTVKVSSSGPDSCSSQSETLVVIPGICPKLELSYQLGPEKGNLQQVDFVLKVTEGPDPVGLTWTWGDGETTQTSGLTASHDFARPYGSTGASYQVSVLAKGPDICEATVGAQVLIPAIPCPSIVKISHQDKLSDIDVEVTFQIEVSGAAPAYYEWTWGDGTANITTDQLTITHAYSREGGRSRKYTASVRSLGPGSCESTAQAELEIPGICPRITGLQYVLADPVGNQQKADFTAFVQMGSPDSYTWHWGDGSATETTTSHQASHSFLRKTGQETQYEVRVIARGPDDCEADGQVIVTIPAIPCPQVTTLTATITETHNSSVSVTAKATVTDGTPDKYLWNWGDGTTSETTIANTVHSYERGNAVQASTLSVKTSGPGSCESTASTQVSIPAIEIPVVPLICRLMGWIVAYLVAVTAGILVVRYVDGSCDAAANGGLTTLAVIMTLLTLGSIAIWYLYRKGLCPPKAGDWYGIGWTTLFTMTATAFYSGSCCGPNGWIAGLVFFVLGGILAYLWFARYAGQNRVQAFIVYIAIFVVASLISIFAVANSFLGCL